jgi:hypothetical protein
MRITKEKIVWDEQDFVKGFVPVQGNSFRTIGDGLANMNNFYPFWTPGIALPGFNPSSVTNVAATKPSAAILDMAMDSGSATAYGVGGTDLQEFSISGNSLTVTGSFPYTITAHGGHNTVSAQSVAFYNVSGVQRVFYSWNDNTDWDVGTYIVGGAFDDDFMSTVPTTPLTGTDLTGGQGKLHPLYVAGDDILYIGSGRYVHAYNGATNTFSAQFLDLPVGYEVVGFAEDEFDLVVFATTGRYTSAVRRAKSRAFFWSADRPASYYKSKDLRDDDVSAPFAFAGTVACFTGYRTGGQCALRVYDGTEFKPVFYWTGSLPSVGGWEVWNNMAVWNSAGAVYMYGSFRDVFTPAGFQIATGSGTTSGFIKSLVSGSLYMSSGIGTSGGLQILSNFGTGDMNTKTAFPEFGAGQRGKITCVQVTSTGSSSGGRSLKISLVPETLVASEVATITSVTAATKTVFKYEIEDFTDRLEEFTSLRLFVQWLSGSGATDAIPIKMVEVFYEPINYPT